MKLLVVFTELSFVFNLASERVRLKMSNESWPKVASFQSLKVSDQVTVKNYDVRIILKKAKIKGSFVSLLLHSFVVV